MLRILLTLFFIIIISACSAAPIKKNGIKLNVESADYLFIDSLMTNSERPPSRNIDVWLTMPDSKRFSPPYPAVILLHSSWGLSRQESYYADIINSIGIATFSIDSFTPRGVEKTSLDQTSVSSASMLSDAYAVLKNIDTLEEFDSERVAVMGFSKGGIVALYSAMNRVQELLSDDELKFAAHIAYYPWCGLHLYDMKTTGAPILIHGGSKDIVTPINRCKDLVENKLINHEYSNIIINEYPKAHHAFDHPTLGKIPIPFTLAMDAQVPTNCTIEEVVPGQFIETFNNTKVTHKNISDVLSACSQYKGVAKYNKRAAHKALLATRDFLSTHILYSQ